MELFYLLKSNSWSLRVVIKRSLWFLASVMPTEMRGEGGIKAGERPDLRRYGNPRFWPEITWYKGISSEVEASIDACYARAVDYWLSGEEAK